MAIHDGDDMTRTVRSSDTMEIRRLKLGDEALAISAIHALKSAEERDGQDASQHHMQTLLERDEDHLIIARDGDRPIGFLLAYGLPRVDRDKNMTCLYEITVESTYRRRGIGSEMVRFLKDACADDNVMEIWLITAEDDAPARALYESTGGMQQPERNVEYVYRV